MAPDCPYNAVLNNYIAVLSNLDQILSQGCVETSSCQLTLYWLRKKYFILKKILKIASQNFVTLVFNSPYLRPTAIGVSEDVTAAEAVQLAKDVSTAEAVQLAKYVTAAEAVQLPQDVAMSETLQFPV